MRDVREAILLDEGFEAAHDDAREAAGGGNDRSAVQLRNLRALLRAVGAFDEPHGDARGAARVRNVRHVVFARGTFARTSINARERGNERPGRVRLISKTLSRKKLA